jgi:hypothetical protein
MPVSINRNTQPIDDPQVNISRPVISMPAKSHQFLDTPAPVPTIAVGDVMAVYGWAPRTTRYNYVARFVDAFFSNFDQFQQPPRHPKWREVNLTAEVPGWTPFPSAHDWLVQHTTAGTAGTATQARFTDFLSQTHPGCTVR